MPKEPSTRKYTVTIQAIVDKSDTERDVMGAFQDMLKDVPWGWFGLTGDPEVKIKSVVAE